MNVRKISREAKEEGSVEKEEGTMQIKGDKLSRMDAEIYNILHSKSIRDEREKYH